MAKLKHADMWSASMPLKAYELVYKYHDVANDSTLLAIEVEELEIIWYGTRAGCRLPSVTGRKKDGDLFIGTLENYWANRDSAEAFAAEELAEARAVPTIPKLQAKVLALESEVANLKKLLLQLRK